MTRFCPLVCLVWCIVGANCGWGQAPSPAPPSFLQDVSQQLSYRLVGPFRGGRSAAVEGVSGKPNLYYMGTCGGGVWRTDDGGTHWTNISDGYFGGSIGAVAVAPSHPNVIYVGGGEVTVRGNVSSGNGMWKSEDGGSTWKPCGLTDSRHISRIRIDPRDPQRVWVAALGHLYGPNAERGVFRTTDGGKTWERVLFVNEEVGAVDLILDPNNPQIVYASTWRVLRTPYSLESGGPGSGLWKSTDGGTTWTEISRAPGLPTGTLGIIGVAVSPVDSQRLWAMIEAADGGLFRSDDAGASWRKVNDDRNLRQRAWYYTRVYAGPQDKDEVYVVNVEFWRSRDGGVKFSSIDTPHGDHHDLWIAPEDPQRLIIADDGGAQVSFNGGATFSTYMNQPTAQFYRVITDNHEPYRIYGAQQDNSTVRIAHRASRGGLDERTWESTAGGESGHLAPHPTQPDLVYGGSYGGYLERLDHRTGESRNVNVWPDNPMGYGARDIRYRFQWNFPIFFSPTNPQRLYAAANVLFVTEDEGQSWQAISPDLTRNDPLRMGPSGGPITKDNTGVEYYCTIFAAAESPHDPQTLWAGTDDGWVHVTRDGGTTWTNVTPPDLPEWAQINSVEVHPTEPGGLYLAATRYKSDDFRPYLYKTTDYGATWEKIVDGIGSKDFTRVIRADPNRPGLLYAGTENGMYLSWNDGRNWQPFQNNLPVVPITDLTIKNGDLIVATQGRSFWMIDDLTPLHQAPEQRPSDTWFFWQPRPVKRVGGGSGQATLTTGANPRSEISFRFWLPQLPADNELFSITIVDPRGEVAQKYSTRPGPGENRLNVKNGFNLVSWNLRYAGAETFDGLILWGGGTQGPLAAPGRYRAEFQWGEKQQTVEFSLERNPVSSASDEDLQAQFEFLIGVRDKLTETHRAIKQIREIRQLLEKFQRQYAEDKLAEPLRELAGTILAEIKEIEETLYQTQNRSGQDPLNFPIRLNNRLSGLVSVVGQGDFPPTAQALAVRDEIVQLIDAELNKLGEIRETRLSQFNKMFRDAEFPYLKLND